MPGGYVGVDVFFVISGYLITRLIAYEIGEDRFSFANFYSRRVRRLGPAFLFTAIFCFLGGFLLFSTQDFTRMSAELQFNLVGLSNIYYWIYSD